MAQISSSSVNHLIHPLYNRTFLIPKSPFRLNYHKFRSPFQYPLSKIEATSAVVTTESVFFSFFLIVTFKQSVGVHSIFLFYLLYLFLDYYYYYY